MKNGKIKSCKYKCIYISVQENVHMQLYSWNYMQLSCAESPAHLVTHYSSCIWGPEWGYDQLGVMQFSFQTFPLALCSAINASASVAMCTNEFSVRTISWQLFNLLAFPGCSD